MTKTCTNLEQSKKLAEILPLESADMCYIKHASSNNPDWRFDDDIPPMILGDVPITEITAETLPCWSLSALLDVIPTRIMSDNVLRIDKGDKDFSIWYDDISYGCVNEELPDITAESSVDACYEMIIELNEFKML